MHSILKSEYAGERSAIEAIIAGYPDLGDYQLARKIADLAFSDHYFNKIAGRVINGGRSFYSVLSVIRRYRAKQQNQPVTA